MIGDTKLWEFKCFSCVSRNFLTEATSTIPSNGYGELLAACTTSRDVTKLIKDPRFKKIRVLVANDVLQDMAGSISIDAVVNACDEVGISTKGYRALYHLLRDCLHQKGLVANIFPCPQRISTTRTVCNSDVINKLGEYLHINDTICIAGWGKTKSTLGQYFFEYNEFNNMFVDLCRLQREMIKFYGVPEGCKWTLL